MGLCFIPLNNVDLAACVTRGIANIKPEKLANIRLTIYQNNTQLFVRYQGKNKLFTCLFTFKSAVLWSHASPSQRNRRCMDSEGSRIE